MATGDEQDHSRQLELGRLQHGGVQVALQVVHPDEGHIPGEGERLGRADADKQGPDEARAYRRRHGVDADRAVRQVQAAPTAIEPRPLKGVGHHGQHQLDVRPPGQLGNYAPVAGVQVDLARDDRADDAAPPVDHCRRRLVAGGLDAEDAAAPGHRSGGAWPGPVPRPGRPSGRRRASIASSRRRYVSVSMSWAHMTSASSFTSA